MILDKNKINLLTLEIFYILFFSLFFLQKSRFFNWVMLNKTIDLDAFYIVEIHPGFAKINNVTNFLKFWYWSSYNVPFGKEIYEKVEIQKIIDLIPSLATSLDYDNCARTKIFRREQSSAISLDNFMKLMRFNLAEFVLCEMDYPLFFYFSNKSRKVNKYKIDPYSEGNPSALEP